MKAVVSAFAVSLIAFGVGAVFVRYCSERPRPNQDAQTIGLALLAAASIVALAVLWR